VDPLSCTPYKVGVFIDVVGPLLEVFLQLTKIVVTLVSSFSLKEETNDEVTIGVINGWVIFE